jgi:SAM-dependent methyltransferase
MEMPTVPNHQISDNWEGGSSYEQYIGRWSRRIAPLFLSWLRIPPGRRWLDLGCGTGALCAAILDHCSPSSVVGVEPSEGFLQKAAENLEGRANVQQGSAMAIPLGDSSVEVVVSGLVLNFVPDQRAALAEITRVTENGGSIGAYVWDYAGKMELLRYFWDAAVELDPDVATMDEGVRFPLCCPDGLRQLFSDGRFREIEVTAIDVPTRFESFEDYWRPFLGGQGPAPAYVMSLDQTARTRLRDHIRQRLPVEADRSISLTARAWAARGTVAK